MSFTPEFQVELRPANGVVGPWFRPRRGSHQLHCSRASRGTSLLDIRVVESNNLVNYSWVNGKAERVAPRSSCGSIERRRGRSKGEVTGMRTSRWTWRFARLRVREAWEKHVSRAGQSGQLLDDLSVATERKKPSAS